MGRIAYQDLFLIGANNLVNTPDYGVPHKEAGLSKETWDLLTDETAWTAQDQMKVASALKEAISCTMNAAGLPPCRMPAQFIAATIAKFVKPVNGLVAAASAPSSFDAVAAAGIGRESEIIETTPEQMMSLVTYFYANDFSHLSGVKVDESAAQAALDMQE